MKLTALMLVRNEEWILGASLRAALNWCDEVAILDHASNDRTMGIIYDIARESGVDRINIRHWPDGSQWSEMDQRQRLLEIGRETGASHFAMIDADEIITANLWSIARGWIEDLKPREVLDVPMIPVWDGLDHYRDDGSIWSTARISLGFKDSPELCWRPRGEEQYHHHARAPHGAESRVTPQASLVHGSGGVFHLQWADWNRVTKKHVWYRILERSRWPQYSVNELNAKYNQAIADRSVTRSQIPSEWWGRYRRDLVRLEGPYWHEEDSRRMIKEKGMAYFQGLDLLGWNP